MLYHIWLIQHLCVSTVPFIYDWNKIRHIWVIVILFIYWVKRSGITEVVY